MPLEMFLKAEIEGNPKNLYTFKVHVDVCKATPVALNGDQVLDILLGANR